MPINPNLQLLAMLTGLRPTQAQMMTPLASVAGMGPVTAPPNAVERARMPTDLPYMDNPAFGGGRVPARSPAAMLGDRLSGTTGRIADWWNTPSGATAAEPSPNPVGPEPIPPDPAMLSGQGPGMGAQGLPEFMTGGSADTMGIAPDPNDPSVQAAQRFAASPNGQAILSMDPMKDVIGQSAGPGPARPAAPVMPPISEPPQIPPAAPIDFAGARDRAAESMPKPPSLGDAPNDTQNFYNNLLRFGLATMAAGGRPGASALGSVGEGGLAAMEGARRDRLDRSKLEQQQFENQLGTRRAAGHEAGEEIGAGQRARSLTLQETKIVQDGKQHGDSTRLHYAQIARQAADAGANRDVQIAIANLHRDTQKLIADASRGSSEAIHVMQEQTKRDQALTKQIDDTIAKGKTEAGGLKASYTADEEAKIRERIILDSPGTTINEQYRTSKAMEKYRAITQAAQGNPDMLGQADAALKMELEAIRKDRIGLNK